jgi:hypothetical protein
VKSKTDIKPEYRKIHLALTRYWQEEPCAGLPEESSWQQSQLAQVLFAILLHIHFTLSLAYTGRYHAVQTGLAIDKSSPEAKNVIVSLLSILEEKKKELHDNESITNDDVAEAYIENYILKLFSWADGQDRNSIFNK